MNSNEEQIEEVDPATLLVCPVCGNTDPTRFRYVEAIESTREVVGFEGGLLVIEAKYETEGSDEDADDCWFRCMGREGTCGERVEISDELEIDFQ